MLFGKLFHAAIIQVPRKLTTAMAVSNPETSAVIRQCSNRKVSIGSVLWADMRSTADCRIGASAGPAGFRPFSEAVVCLQQLNNGSGVF